MPMVGPNKPGTYMNATGTFLKVWLDICIVARFNKKSVHYHRVSDLMSQDSRTIDQWHVGYSILVYTTQVNSTFCVRRLASSEVISQVLFTSEQPKEKMPFSDHLLVYCHK